MTLMAGCATVDITPPIGIELVGYSRSQGAVGILDRLQATALLFQEDGPPVALVNIDHLGMLTAQANPMRAAIAIELGTNMERVMLLFTHTHSGPDTEANVQEAVRQAAANLRPAHVAWGLTQGRIGMNRRENVDGRAVMGSNPAGPVDDRIGVLSVHDAESRRRIALLVTCTADGNVLKGDNLLVSGDFPGWTRRLLQGALACPVLVHNGAAGNLNALYRGSLADLERMAQAVSDPVLGLLPELTPASDAPLWCGSVHVQAPLHFFGGYTNGWTGYLPTAEEFAFGGYAVDWNSVYAGWLGGLYMPAQPQVPELVINAVSALVHCTKFT